MISFDDADARVIREAWLLPVEPVSLSQALGRVLAEDLHAGIDKRFDLLVIGIDHLVEFGIAIGWVIDVCGDCRLPGGRADRTSDEFRTRTRCWV